MGHSIKAIGLGTRGMEKVPWITEMAMFIKASGKMEKGTYRTLILLYIKEMDRASTDTTMETSTRDRFWMTKNMVTECYRWSREMCMKVVFFIFY